jgi:tryptophan synthase beta subunit
MSTVDEIARLPIPERGRFGAFGGQYVAETLMPAIAELEAAWRAARGDAAYWAEVDALLADYVGRPSRLYRARRLSAAAGATVYLKREDLNQPARTRSTTASARPCSRAGWASGA